MRPSIEGTALVSNDIKANESFTTHKTSHHHRTSSPSRTYRYKSDGGTSLTMTASLVNRSRDLETDLMSPSDVKLFGKNMVPLPHFLILLTICLPMLSCIIFYLFCRKFTIYFRQCKYYISFFTITLEYH